MEKGRAERAGGRKRDVRQPCSACPAGCRTSRLWVHMRVELVNAVPLLRIVPLCRAPWRRASRGGRGAQGAGGGWWSRHCLAPPTRPVEEEGGSMVGGERAECQVVDTAVRHGLSSTVLLSSSRVSDGKAHARCLRKKGSCVLSALRTWQDGQHGRRGDRGYIQGLLAHSSPAVR